MPLALKWMDELWFTLIKHYHSAVQMNYLQTMRNNVKYTYILRKWIRTPVIPFASNKNHRQIYLWSWKTSSNDLREHKEGWDFYLCWILIYMLLAWICCNLKIQQAIHSRLYMFHTFNKTCLHLFYFYHRSTSRVEFSKFRYRFWFGKKSAVVHWVLDSVNIVTFPPFVKLDTQTHHFEFSFCLNSKISN